MLGEGVALTFGKRQEGPVTYSDSLNIMIPECTPVKASSFPYHEYLESIKILGFDTSRQRGQGFVYIDRSLNQMGGYHYEPRWYTVNPIYIRTTSTFKRKVGDRVVEIPDRSYWLDANNLRRHAMLSVNQSSRYPNKYIGLSRELKKAAWLIDGKVLGLTQSPWSTTVAFDIDNHGNTQEGRGRVLSTLYTLVQRFDNRLPIYIEFNDINGSCHVFFKTSQYVKDNDIRSFVDEFNRDSEMKIEARYTTKLFRLPCAVNYTGGSITVDHALHSVSFQPYPKDTQVFRMIQDIRDYIDQDVCILPYETLKVKKTGKKPRKAISTRSRVGAGRGNWVSALIGNPGFMMRRGERYNTMIKLASRIMNYGLGVEEFKMVVKANQLDSQDLATWSEEQFNSNCERLWSFVRTTHIDRAGYQNSNNPVTTEIPYRIQQRLPLIVSKILDELGTSRANARERHYREITYVLSRMLERAIYEHNNPRHYSGFGDHRDDLLSKGYYFPRAFQDSIKSQGNIKQDIYRLVSVILTRSGLFKQIQTTRTGYRYNSKHNFCRQFTLVGIENIKDITASIILVLDKIKREYFRKEPMTILAETEDTRYRWGDSFSDVSKGLYFLSSRGSP